MAQSQSSEKHSKYRITSARKLGLSNGRTAVIVGFISLLLFGGIVPRLVYLQITEGSRNQELAEEIASVASQIPRNAAKFSIAKAAC